MEPANNLIYLKLFYCNYVIKKLLVTQYVQPVPPFPLLLFLISLPPGSRPGSTDGEAHHPSSHLPGNLPGHHPKDGGLVAAGHQPGPGTEGGVGPRIRYLHNSPNSGGQLTLFVSGPCSNNSVWQTSMMAKEVWCRHQSF